ncbi:MAG: YbaK/EbsC family protein [Pyramidobacter sp.]|jgi:prolyl-tRNA synthetase
MTMKWMSQILLPLSSGHSSKLRDAGTAKIIRAGCALWNPNDEKIILLPAGQKLYSRTRQYLLDALQDFAPQLTDADGSSRGLLDVAVRVVRRSGDLPLLLAQQRGDRLELLGLHSDLEASLDMANDALRTVGRAICSLNVTLRRVDRLTPQGHAVDLLCSSQFPLRGEEGLICKTCGWLCTADSPFRGGNDEAAKDKKEPTLKEVATPHCSTVDELCRFLKIPKDNVVKTMFYVVEGRGLTAVILRADRRVCAEKLRAALRGAPLHPASPQELSAVMGDAAGFMGPVGLPASVPLVADYSAVDVSDVAVGANKKGFHLTGACWGRDFKTDAVTDLSYVQEGDLCPNCGATLQKGELRSIARFFPIDPACAVEPSLTFFDGREKSHVPAWSASIDVTALLSALMEKNDRWPEELAPYDDYVWWEGDDAPASISELAAALEEAGRQCVGDDRTGIKAVDRAAQARASCAPRLLFLRTEKDLPVVDVTCHGTTETLPLRDFIGQVKRS